MSNSLPLPQANSMELPTQSPSFNTICNFCSVGCTIEVCLENNNFQTVKGSPGLINEHGEYCNIPERGYQAFNKFKRITAPLLKIDSKFSEISWDDAFEILNENITNGNPDEKAFFAGARLTNEEQYLIMKICRTCARTNDIGSFHYIGRGTGYTKLSRANIPFAELIEAKKVYIIGAEVKKDNPVAADFIFKNQSDYNIPVNLITTDPNSDLTACSSEAIIIKSYFHFVKAVNHFLVSREMEDKEYIKNLVQNFSQYKQTLLNYDFEQLCSIAGVSGEIVKSFAEEFSKEPHAVIVFAENELSGHTCGEIFNLAMLTGKHGRSGAGLMLLKENNNTHGLHDMGVMWNLGPGATPWDDPFQRSTVEFTWRSKELSVSRGYTLHKLRDKGYDSLFIFGEDPVGCANDQEDVRNLLSKSRFIAVQDYFMTPTAELANLILPASLPFESGGTFTNSQRVIQKVSKKLDCPLQYPSWKQLEEILSRNGYDRYETIDDITFEIASLLPKFCTSSKLLFRINVDDNYNPLFKAGCDALMNTAKQ
ncbi:MAG TPA: molybdopterin-dependent oxidoreductase [Lentimicrobium sp.]|nr:molybdopterin-dependent oxidoreductase [Lentimicrobium sp.]